MACEDINWEEIPPVLFKAYNMPGKAVLVAGDRRGREHYFFADVEPLTSEVQGRVAESARGYAEKRRLEFKTLHTRASRDVARGLVGAALGDSGSAMLYVEMMPCSEGSFEFVTTTAKILR